MGPSASRAGAGSAAGRLLQRGEPGGVSSVSRSVLLRLFRGGVVRALETKAANERGLGEEGRAGAGMRGTEREREKKISCEEKGELLS